MRRVAQDADVHQVVRALHQIAAQHSSPHAGDGRARARHDLGDRSSSVTLPFAGVSGRSDAHQHPDRLRSFGGEVGERGGGGPPADLLEREPVGAEMDALDGEVDAQREGGPADGNERTVVAEIGRRRALLREAREGRAQDVELPAGAEGGGRVAHRLRAASRERRTRPESVATQRYSPCTATSRTAAGMSSGTWSAFTAPDPRFQKASPVVPPIQTPPESPASEVTVPRSPRPRETCQAPAGSRQASSFAVARTRVSAVRVSARMVVLSDGA